MKRTFGSDLFRLIPGGIGRKFLGSITRVIERRDSMLSTRMLFMIIACGLRLSPLAIPDEVIDPAQGVPDPEGKLVWYDGTLLDMEGRGWADAESPYDRLPARAKEKVRKAVWNLSRCSAGISLGFITDADRIEVRWTLVKSGLAMPHMPATGVSGIDLYRRNERGAWIFEANGRPGGIENRVAFTTAGSELYRLFLPLYNGVKRLEIGLPPKARLERPAPRSLKKRGIVFYGTSITQGGCASRPGLAATTIAGRLLDAPVINLGFSGNGKMEPELADLLAELDPAVFVLDCLWNMSLEQIDERFVPFVIRLRAARPDTPIVLAEDSNVRDRSGPKGERLRVHFKRLNAEGVKGIHLLPNTNMLGADGEGTVDGVHPNDLGMMRQAKVFADFLSPLLEKAK